MSGRDAEEHPASAPELLYEKDGHIATVVLNRPHCHCRGRTCTARKGERHGHRARAGSFVPRTLTDGGSGGR